MLDLCLSYESIEARARMSKKRKRDQIRVKEGKKELQIKKSGVTKINKEQNWF